jgi:3-hydroxyisobutyrate dehydrogenase-like beta-hydroxyacid dehydrogenase
MDVGFIGIGSMGTRIVDLLIEGGHNVTLWARRPQTLEPYRGRSQVAATPAELGRTSELVGICVWDEHDVDEVVLGLNGVLSTMRPGSAIAIHSTISPEACRRLRATALDRGVELMDAPVSVGSAQPKLLVMLGGETDVIARYQEAFESFGSPVVHLGPVGSGQIAKLVNNTLLAATAGLAEDAITMGAELGLRPDALLSALSAGSSRGTWAGLLAARAATADIPGRTHEWAHKDVGLTTELAIAADIAATRDILRLGARGVEVLD